MTIDPEALRDARAFLDTGNTYANPEAVLAFLDEIDALRERVQQLDLYVERVEADRNYTIDRFMQQQNRLDRALIRVGYLERMLEFLHAATRPAATLLRAMKELPMDERSHEAIRGHLRELDAALHATNTATTVLARLAAAEQLRAAVASGDAQRQIDALAAYDKTRGEL